MLSTLLALLADPAPLAKGIPCECFSGDFWVWLDAHLRDWCP